ncbi:MAG: hypothetical protein ACRCX4_07950 [Bacteroidales bacterium]
MKKFILPFVAIALLFSSCGEGGSQKQLREENDSLKTALSQVQNEFNETLSVLNDVEAGFQKIREAENYVSTQTSQEITPGKRQRIANDISMITETLEKNKEQLNKLKDQLNKSGNKSSQLQKMVDRLTAEVEQKTQLIVTLQEELAKKDIRINELDRSVASLNSQVSEIAEEAQEQKSTIKEQDKELNAAWYIYGTKSDLKKQNILTGGGLFKRKELLRGDFNQDIFNHVDIRNMKVLEIPAKKAKVLTNHPEDSYTLGKDASGQMVLTITDAKAFWSLSRYLVIEID